MIIDAPEPYASAPKGIHYAQACRQREKTLHLKVNTFLTTITSLTTIISWHPENCLTYVAPALCFQVASVIFDGIDFWLFFFSFIQATCRWKWYYRCTSGPPARGGPGGFDGTAASCSVPVKHAPPTLWDRICAPVWPPRRGVQ